MSGYVKFTDVDGESIDKNHKKWIDLEGFSVGVERTKPSAPSRRKPSSDVTEVPDPNAPELHGPTPPPPRNIRLPVWFRFKLNWLFPMLMQIHRGNQTCDGWFEFDDPAGRVLQSMQFKGGKINKLRAVTAAGGNGPAEAEVELTAEQWNFKLGASPEGPVRGFTPGKL